jgi:hypothetical protein
MLADENRNRHKGARRSWDIERVAKVAIASEDPILKRAMTAFMLLRCIYGELLWDEKKRRLVVHPIAGQREWAERLQRQISSDKGLAWLRVVLNRARENPLQPPLGELYLKLSNEERKVLSGIRLRHFWMLCTTPMTKKQAEWFERWLTK